MSALQPAVVVSHQQSGLTRTPRLGPMGTQATGLTLYPVVKIQQGRFERDKAPVVCGRAAGPGSPC